MPSSRPFISLKRDKQFLIWFDYFFQGLNAKKDKERWGGGGFFKRSFSSYFFFGPFFSQAQNLTYWKKNKCIK